MNDNRVDNIYDLPNISEADQILRRMKESLGVKSDMPLAQFIGVTRQAISKARKTETIPPAWLLKFALEIDCSLDWILFGIGSKRRSDKKLQAKKLFDDKWGKEMISRLRVVVERQIETVEKSNEFSPEMMASLIDLVKTIESWNSQIQYQKEA